LTEVANLGIIFAIPLFIEVLPVIKVMLKRQNDSEEHSREETERKDEEE
jgi:hypothetical protein